MDNDRSKGVEDAFKEVAAKALKSKQTVTSTNHCHDQSTHCPTSKNKDFGNVHSNSGTNVVVNMTDNSKKTTTCGC